MTQPKMDSTPEFMSPPVPDTHRKRLSGTVEYWKTRDSMWGNCSANVWVPTVTLWLPEEEAPLEHEPRAKAVNPEVLWVHWIPCGYHCPISAWFLGSCRDIQVCLHWHHLEGLRRGKSTDVRVSLLQWRKPTRRKNSKGFGTVKAQNITHPPKQCPCY